ncbi:MAG TPA: hypothetical protein DD706_06975 [Nitrospiraceae bacterium]|nr:hypothetical protein [Nitrospiraceae bacterium]
MPLAGTVEYCKTFAVSFASESPRLTREKWRSVQKGRSSKATAAWTSGAYGGVREHGLGAGTPLAAFFNTPLRQNPLRTDFQQHYEQIVSAYNREKDRVTIEHTFEALFKLVQELDDEAHRALREGLDEESLAIFDLLNKPDLKPSDIQRIKSVATQLLMRLKEEKLRVDQWREKEATRDAVRQAIHDFLWSEDTGLPVDCFAEADVEVKAEDVFRHIYRAYPTVPSPYFTAHAAM